MTLNKLIHIINSCKQYKNNYSCTAFAKITAKGTQRHLLTCTGILLISSGRFVSYFRVKGKIDVERHSKVRVPAKYKKKHAERVVIPSNSPGLLDFIIRLVNSVFNLPGWQVKYFREFRLQKNC